MGKDPARLVRRSQGCSISRAGRRRPGEKSADWKTSEFYGPRSRRLTATLVACGLDPGYFASSFIAFSSPASVVGNMRPFISSFITWIDWR
jgi:hypothetical protein